MNNGIRHAGALTGLATAGIGQERILVVGSTFVERPPDRPSPYSAAAQSADALPDWSAPGDASRALRGHSVRGNHAGEVVRVMGTSFSAPLLARALVNDYRPKPGPTPPPPKRVGRARMHPRPD